MRMYLTYLQFHSDFFFVLILKKQKIDLNLNLLMKYTEVAARYPNIEVKSYISHKKCVYL
jgi:hypothetical protein